MVSFSKSNIGNSVLTFHHGFESDNDPIQKGSFIDFTGTNTK